MNSSDLPVAVPTDASPDYFQTMGIALRGRDFSPNENKTESRVAVVNETGWSLYGLAESLRVQKEKPEEAKTLRAKFDELWAKADTKITSSCLCQPAL